jgi:Protein of unknown function (DUF3396)
MTVDDFHLENRPRGSTEKKEPPKPRERRDIVLSSASSAPWRFEVRRFSGSFNLFVVPATSFQHDGGGGFMTVDAEDLMQQLDRSLSVQDDDGHVVLQPALLATLYFTEPFRREVREAVVSCCEDYFSWCGPHLRWALNPDTGLFEPYGEGNGSKPRSWLPILSDNESWSLAYHGADHYRGASAFSVRAVGTEERPHEVLGFLRISLPLLWFTEGRGALSEVMHLLCRKLKPLSGYAGIGVIESPNRSISQEFEALVYRWAQRFPGLEVDYPTGHSIWLREGRPGGKGGIKGVNWLTVVGDRYLAELGSVDQVEADLAALDARFLVHRFEGGAIVQAGPRPQLGDAERNRWPELYVKLAKYLKPIRITEHRPFHSGLGMCFDVERSEAWLRRFDDR